MHIRAFARRSSRARGSIYLASFFFTLHYAAILYVNSAFLSEFFSAGIVTLLFALGGLGNIALLAYAPQMIRAIGNKHLFLLLVFVELVATLGLAFTINPYLLALFFIIYGALPMLVYYCLDILLETVSSERTTGTIRGVLLTVSNTGISFAPLLVGLLSPDGDFKPLYIASGLFLVPILYIALTHFNKIKDSSNIPRNSFVLREWWGKKDLTRATFGRFSLEFFYVLMTIYTPLYLTQILGFTWGEVSIIFTIMLLPFLLFELPVGELADHWCGEKEIETVGFLIMGLALLVMPFLGKSLALWALVLFVSRIGASFVEVTNESYFFKHVKGKDSGLISIFRMSRPVATIVGAYAGILIISIFSYSGIFFLLAVVTLLGMLYTSRIKDTR